MCLAYPMQVVSLTGTNTAVCVKEGVQHIVDVTFLPDVEPGDWLTVHLGIARERVSEADAKQILDALLALDMVRQGQTDVDHLFADLVDREPPRPPVSGGEGTK